LIADVMAGVETVDPLDLILSENFLAGQFSSKSTKFVAVNLLF